MQAEHEYANTDQRERAVAYWESVVRPQIVTGQEVAPPEPLEVVEARLMAEASKPLTVSTEEVAQKLAAMAPKREDAA